MQQDGTKSEEVRQHAARHQPVFTAPGAKLSAFLFFLFAFFSSSASACRLSSSLPLSTASSSSRWRRVCASSLIPRSQLAPRFSIISASRCRREMIPSRLFESGIRALAAAGSTRSSKVTLRKVSKRRSSVSVSTVSMGGKLATETETEVEEVGGMPAGPGVVLRLRCCCECCWCERIALAAEPAFFPVPF